MRSVWMAMMAGVLVAAGAGAVRAQQPAAPKNIDEYIRLVRTGVQAEKSKMLGEALELDATQSAAFWPVYKKYEAELTAIGDQRYAGIKDYAANYEAMSEAKATELSDKAIALEEQRLALVKKYLGEFRKVLPAVKAARWYQAEMAINKIIDLRLAAEVPLAK